MWALSSLWSSQTPSPGVHGARDSSAGKGDAAIKAAPLYLEKITRTTPWALFLGLEVPVEAKSSNDVLVLGKVNPQRLCS